VLPDGIARFNECERIQSVDTRMRMGEVNFENIGASVPKAGGFATPILSSSLMY
jgi:hypothetical protein